MKSHKVPSRITPDNKCRKFQAPPAYQGNNTGRGAEKNLTSGSAHYHQGTEESGKGGGNPGYHGGRKMKKKDNY